MLVLGGREEGREGGNSREGGTKGGRKQKRVKGQDTQEKVKRNGARKEEAANCESEPPAGKEHPRILAHPSIHQSTPATDVCNLGNVRAHHTELTVLQGVEVVHLVELLQGSYMGYLRLL